MKNVRILIVEDNLIIAESLKIMLEDMGYIVPAIYISGKEALDKFRPDMADIIIMDIQLADNTNGIDTSIEIRKISTAPVIFITDNKSEYLRKKAIYETNSVQYISKPFNRLDLEIAIDLAIKAIQGHNLLLNKNNSSSYLINDCIFVKDGHSFKKIFVSDILFLKADGSYCSLTYNTGSKRADDKVATIIFSENLSFLEEKLKFALDLVRIHRSYIINIKQVTRLQENRLWLEEKEIPIGKTYKGEIRDRFRLI